MVEEFIINIIELFCNTMQPQNINKLINDINKLIMQLIQIYSFKIIYTLFVLSLSS